MKAASKIKDPEIIEEAVFKDEKPHHTPDVFGAFFLIFLGVVLLLNNMGALSWEFWRLLVNYWPVLLIIWGFQAIFGKGFAGRWIVGIIGAIILLAIAGRVAGALNPEVESFLSSSFSFWGKLEKLIPLPKSQIITFPEYFEPETI